MAKAIDETRTENTLQTAAHAETRDWRKAMSDNVAYALLVYTGLTIFVTVNAMKSGGGMSILPYLALVVLVVDQ